MADFDNIQWEDVKTDAELPDPEFIGGEIKEEDLAGIQWEDVNPVTQSVMDDRDQKVYNVPVSMDGIDATFAIDTQHNGADASNYFGKVEIVDKAAQSYVEGLKDSANPLVALAGKVAEPLSELGFAMKNANNPLKSIARGALTTVDFLEDTVYSYAAKRKLSADIQAKQIKEGKQSWLDIWRPEWLPTQSHAEELAAEMKKFRQGLKDIQDERRNKTLPQEQMNDADKAVEGMFGALSQTGVSLGSVFVSGNPVAASAMVASLYAAAKKEDVWEEAVGQGVPVAIAEAMGNISAGFEGGVEFLGDLVCAKFAKVMPIRNLASETMRKAAVKLAQRAQAAGASGTLKAASKHLDSIVAGTLKGAAGEYSEEVIQNFGGDLLTNAYGITQIDLGESWQNANIAGAYAAFAGGVAGGGGTALHNRLAKKVNAQLVDTVAKANPEIKPEEAQIIADGLQEVFYQEDAAAYVGELNKLAGKQIALMQEDKGVSEKNVAAETRKMLKEKYAMTDEQIDQTIKIGVNMIDMRNQYSKAYNYMREELELSGRDPQLADSEARIFAARMSAFARAEGLNLDDLLKERGLKVQQMRLADFFAGQRGENNGSAISLKDWQDMRELKKTTKKSTQRKGLLNFIKEKGGVKDTHGDLKAMDAGRQHIGLLNKNGVNLDDMALAAWEAGYFEGVERPDINTLLEAMRDELAGRPHYSSKDGWQEQQDREQQLAEMAEELERDGIDLENDSYAQANAKIREAQRAAGEMRNAAREDNEYRTLDENSQEQYAIMRENGASHDEAMAVLRPSEDLPLFQESLDLAKENQRLDDINPAYEGETININGQERPVYNSNGDRIAKSKEALENFYKWFGDSKVVDEQGRPLVVYHGTNAEFSVFDKSKQKGSSYYGKGFYFTNWSDVSTYGKIKMPLYLNIKNPLIIKEGDISSLKAAEDIIGVHPDMPDEQKEWDFEGWAKYTLGYRSDIEGNIESVLSSKGYDGVIILDTENDGQRNKYVAFESNQVKSTSNRGTYSESEDNIYWQSMYPSKLKTFAEFYDDVMSGENTKPRYFTENINGIKIDIPTNAMWHDGNKHSLNKKEWLGIIKALKKNKIVASAYGDYNRMNGTPIKMIVDVNGVEYGITFEHMQSGRNLLQSAFVLKDKGWIRPKQKKSSQTVANEPQPKSSRLGNSLYDIISNLEENVNREKVLYQSAFAGSRVDYDRPSLEAIGSGEGNQAHGWGLYYALNRDVAEGYRKSFTEEDALNDLVAKHEGLLRSDARDVVNMGKDNVLSFYKEELANYENQNITYGDSNAEIVEKHILGYRERIRAIETITDEEIDAIKNNKGQVHEVDIPENPYLLDEQLPFGAQPEFVKTALKSMVEKENLKYEVLKNLENNYSGRQIYNALSSELGSPKAASQMLEKYGIKGIAYDGSQDGRCFVIFNPDDVKVLQKFYQGEQSQTGRGGVARGAYSNNIIYLFEHADASTVIHELGHYFLDDLQKYGKSEKSKEQLQAIYNYLGAKDGVITTEMHEYFADSFEVYLKEGKAPNSLLRGVFIKFKNWMRQIFSEVKRLEGVKLTDEMRKTFDEMLGGKSLDFAMQTASENMQANAKSGYIPPSVADFAIELIHNGKMSRAQMDDILERLKTGDLARADVYKELKAIEAKGEQHGEQLNPFDRVKYKEALLKDNINKGKVIAKIETLMKWAQPRDINGRTVGRFPNKKMNDFFIEANRLMNLEKDEAKEKINANKAIITKIMQSGKLDDYDRENVLGMKFDKEADRPELVNALAIENRLLGVAAKNISLDNAIKLYNDLQDSYNEGRLTANVTGDIKRARKMKMREATIRVLLGDGKVNPMAEKNKIKQALNRMGTSQMSWGGLMDILSMNDKTSKSGQSELSQMMDVFQEEQNNAQWVADDGEKFSKFFEAKLQGANNGAISVSKYINNELNKKTKLQWGKYSRTFTKDELIDIYMKAKDKETKEIMLKDTLNGFDQGFLDLVNQNLNADDRAFADALFDFYNDNWTKINAFYEEKYGVTMPKNDYYSPRTMLREGISVSDGSPAFAASGFTKKRTARVGASIDIQGAFKVWNNYVTNTNRWLAWSDKLMDINSVFGNREVKNIIANQWGDNMNSRIQGEVERMAGAKGNKIFSSKLLTALRSNYAKSVLALKPALMIKQLTSFPAYWNEMSAVDFAAGLADFFKHPKEAIEILGNTTLMKTRGTDIIRDFAEISKMDVLKGKKGIKWSDAMMINIKLGDRGAIYMGGWALYKSELKKNLAQGMSEEEAKALALERFERVTDETQQSGRLSQQSFWQSNPALRMFTMFQSSQNQYLRKEINAVRGALTGRMDKAQAAKTLFIFHILLPCLFQFASDGFDWDKEAQLRAAVLGSLNGVFVLNSLLTKIYDHTINRWVFDIKPKYGKGQLGVREIVPFWASVEDLAKEFEKLANDDVDLIDVAKAFKFWDSDEFLEGDGGKAASKIIKAGGELSGVPLKYPLDVIKNFGDYAEDGKYRKELLLYLGWSPYALRENDNKIELLDF